MATKCRRTKRFKIERITILVSILLLIVGTGFLVGRFTAPDKTITVVEAAPTPVISTNELLNQLEIQYYDVPLSQSLQNYIYEICMDKEVPMSLVIAMIEVESGFNHEIVSGTNDTGLMQINEVNYEWLDEEYRCANMTDPYQNVFSGIHIIGNLLNKYEGDYHKSLMAYNMGEYGAKKARENGITSTKYSEKIVELMLEYEEEISND